MRTMSATTVDSKLFAVGRGHKVQSFAAAAAAA